MNVFHGRGGRHLEMTTAARRCSWTSWCSRCRRRPGRRVLDLALSRHRWEEPAYEPARAEGYLRTYRAMVEEFDPADAADAADAALAQARGRVLPGPHEAATASCVRHRVLDALPFREGCVFCTEGSAR
ncbi:hypothetical protein [Streptomyces yangpuensis]|uniref:hypothetical protein n=1 Tax=Streptomyces yangpuensis TaxID=1648182 RepID=UPI003657E75E